MARQQRRHTNPHRNMSVVAAGMHLPVIDFGFP
jgi:hypothetical protein